jgi:hypothetical protein
MHFGEVRYLHLQVLAVLEGGVGTPNPLEASCFSKAPVAIYLLTRRHVITEPALTLLREYQISHTCT